MWAFYTHDMHGQTTTRLYALYSSCYSNSPSCTPGGGKSAKSGAIKNWERNTPSERVFCELSENHNATGIGRTGCSKSKLTSGV